MYNFDFSIAAFIILIIVAINLCIGNKNFNVPSIRVFLSFVIMSFFTIILDISTAVVSSYHINVSSEFEYFLNIAFLATQFISPIFMPLFIIFINDNSFEKYKKEMFLCVLPAVIGLILLFSTPKTRLIFYIDPVNGYTYGPLHAYVYIAASFYMVMSIIAMIVVRSKVTSQKFVAVFLMISINICTSLIQFFFSQYLLIAFAITLSILILYMNFLSTDVHTDADTGMNNQQAYFARVKALKKRDSDFYSILIFPDNFRVLSDLLGSQGINSVVFEIGKYMSQTFGADNVFRYKEDVFIVMETSAENVKIDINEIQHRFEKNWCKNRYDINFKVNIFSLAGQEFNEEIPMSQQIDFILEHLKTQTASESMMSSKLSERVKRVMVIEKALIEAIENESIEMHYQPIYCVPTKSFRSMEALARLQIEGIGYVPPDEFIDIAEKNGMIIELGATILKSVFRFMADNDLKMYGIDFIEINISIIQLLQADFASSVLKLIDEYEIDPKMLNFEITETSAVTAKTVLIQNMDILKNAGINYSLDDYGTGYSTVTYIVRMPFNIIKLDKTFIWSYFEQDNSRIILTNMINMMKELNLALLAEGVETEEQCEIMKNLGIDFFQGWYYAKPMDESSFLEFVQEKNFLSSYNRFAE